MNHVEDALIAEIDKAKGGVDSETENNQQAETRQHKKFYVQLVNDSFFWAGLMPPGTTDKQISMQAAAVGFRVAAAKMKLELLVNETGLSRRQLRGLAAEDPRRLRFALYEAHIYELEECHSDLVRCANARKFLKEQPGLMKLYIQFRFNRCTNRLDVVMNKLALLFPATVVVNQRLAV